MPIQQCDSCSAPIWWATSDKDPEPGERPKRNPIDHATVGDPKGNLATWRDEHGVLRYHYLKKGEEPGPGQKRAVSHYASCPQAAEWRARGRRPARAAPSGG